MDTRDYFAYGDAAMDKLQSTLADHPDAASIVFETLSPFKGVKDLLAHFVGAEERWIARAQGELPEARYEDKPSETVEALFSDWKSRRKQFKEYVGGLSPEAVATPIPQKFPFKAEPVGMTVDQMVYTIVNHQLYHTAQISMALQRSSIDPPNFDFAALML